MYVGFLYPPSQIRLVVRGRRPLLMLGPAFSSREAAERAVKRELAAIASAKLPLAGFVAELKRDKSVKELWQISARARVSNPAGEIAISLAGHATRPHRHDASKPVAVSSKFPDNLWPEAEALRQKLQWTEAPGLFVELPAGSHPELPHHKIGPRTWWYVGPDKIAKVMGRQVGAFMKKRSSKTREAFLTELAELASLTRAEAVTAARGVEDSPAVKAELEAAKKKRSEASKVRAGRKEAQEKSIRSRAAKIGVPELVAEARRAEQESKKVIESNRKDLKETRAAKRKATPAERKKLDKKVELLKAQLVNNRGMLRTSTQRLQLALRIEENCPPAPKAEPCPPGGGDRGLPPMRVKLENGTPVVRGSQTLIFYPGPSGPESLKGYYGLIKASELVPSHDPVTFAPDKRYDQSLQERDYAGDKNEQQKVLRQAQAFKPELVLNSNPDAVNGPPIIDQQGQVLGGNSRAMTILRVLADTPAKYQKALTRELADHCEQFGLEGATAAEKKGHVLVRVLTDDRYSSRDISTLFNRALMQTIARETGAISIGKMIPASIYMQLASRLDAGDTLSQAIGKDSMSIITALQSANVITPQNQAEWLVPGGSAKLSSEGIQRLKSGIVGAVIGDRTLATRIAKMPSLANFIERIAPVAMVIDTWDPDNKTGYNWIIALRKALCEAPSVGNKRLGVAGGFEDHYGTTGMFAPSCPQIFNAADPLPAVVLRWLVEAKGTPAKFGRAVFTYWRQIPGEIKHPEQPMLMPRSVADIKREGKDPDGLRKAVLGMASVADVSAAGGPQRWLAGKAAPAVPGPEPPALVPRVELPPKRPSLTDLLDPLPGKIRELAKGVYYVAGHALSRDRYWAPRYIEVTGTHAYKGRTLLDYKVWSPDLGRRYGDMGPREESDPLDSELVQEMIKSATPSEYFSLSEIPRVPSLSSRKTETGGELYKGNELVESLPFRPRWLAALGPEPQDVVALPWSWTPYATKAEAEADVKAAYKGEAVFLFELHPYVKQQAELEVVQQQEIDLIEMKPGTVYYMPRVNLGQDHYTVERYVLILGRAGDRISTLSWIPELGAARELHESSVIVDSRNHRRMQEYAIPTRFASLADIPPLPDLRYVALGSSPPSWQTYDGDKLVGPVLDKAPPAWVLLAGPRLRHFATAMGLPAAWEALRFSPGKEGVLAAQEEGRADERRRRTSRGSRETSFVLAVPERARASEITLQQAPELALQQAPELALQQAPELALQQAPELALQQAPAAFAELEIQQQQAPAPEARAVPVAGTFDFHGPEQKRTARLSGLTQGQVYYVPQHAMGGAILMQVGNILDAPPGAQPAGAVTDPVVLIRAYHPEPGTSPADAADRWHHVNGERWASIRRVAQPTPYFFLEDMPALDPIPVIAEPDGYFAVQWTGMGAPTKRYIRAPRYAVVSLTEGGFWALEKALHDNKEAYRLTLERQDKGQKAFGVNLKAAVPAPGVIAPPAKGVRKPTAAELKAQALATAAAAIELAPAELAQQQQAPVEAEDLERWVPPPDMDPYEIEDLIREAKPVYAQHIPLEFGQDEGDLEWQLLVFDKADGPPLSELPRWTVLVAPTQEGGLWQLADPVATTFEEAQKLKKAIGRRAVTVQVTPAVASIQWDEAQVAARRERTEAREAAQAALELAKKQAAASAKKIRAQTNLDARFAQWPQPREFQWLRNEGLLFVPGVVYQVAASRAGDDDWYLLIHDAGRDEDGDLIATVDTWTPGVEPKEAKIMGAGRGSVLQSLQSKATPTRYTSREQYEAAQPGAVVSLAEARERKAAELAPLAPGVLEPLSPGQAKEADALIAAVKEARARKAARAPSLPALTNPLEQAARDSYFNAQSVYMIRPHHRMDGSQATAELVELIGFGYDANRQIEAKFKVWQPAENSSPGADSRERALRVGGEELREWERAALELDWLELADLPPVPELRARRLKGGKWQVLSDDKPAYVEMNREPRWVTLGIPVSGRRGWEVYRAFSDRAKGQASVETLGRGQALLVFLGKPLAPERALPTLDPGMIVTIGSRSKKRYLVIRQDQFGKFDLKALSGGMRGSSPDSMRRDQLNIADDQQIEFSGAKAGERSSRAALAMQSATAHLAPGARSMDPLEYPEKLRRTTASLKDGKPIVRWRRVKAPAAQAPAAQAPVAQAPAVKAPTTGPTTWPSGLMAMLPDHRGTIGTRVSLSELRASATDIGPRMTARELGQRLLNLTKRIRKIRLRPSGRAAGMGGTVKVNMTEAITATKSAFDLLFFDWNYYAAELKIREAEKALRRAGPFVRKTDTIFQLGEVLKILRRAASPYDHLGPGKKIPLPEQTGTRDFLELWHSLDPGVQRVAIAIWYGTPVLKKYLLGHGADESTVGKSQGILELGVTPSLFLTPKGTAVLLVLGPVDTWKRHAKARAYDPTTRKKKLLAKGIKHPAVPVWVDKSGRYFSQPHAGQVLTLDEMDDAAWRRLLLDLYKQFDRGHLTKEEQKTVRSYAERITAAHPKAAEWGPFDILAELARQDDRWARAAAQERHALAAPEPRQQQAPAPVAELAPIAQVEVVQQQEFTPPEMGPVEAREILTLFKEGLKEIWQQ